LALYPNNVFHILLYHSNPPLDYHQSAFPSDDPGEMTMVCRSRFGLFLSLLMFLSCSQGSAQTSLRKTIAFSTTEGTTLAFDVSGDGRSIVFDLLGQLWLLPSSGGAARPITDAVRDSSEDNDPTFSPDGRRVVFRGERNGRTGLWLLSLDSGRLRQLTQLTNPEGYDGNASWSPNGKVIAFAHTVFPNSNPGRPRSAIMLLDATSGDVRELSIAGLPTANVSDPVWLNEGKQIAFVTRFAESQRGGRVWIVPASGGSATPLTPESVPVLAPAFSSDGRRVAYFALDGARRMQVWVQEGNAASQPVQLTNDKDVAVTRVRWLPRENRLMYSADGRLWTIGASAGPRAPVPFTARIEFTRQQLALPQAKFPQPGLKQPARSFMGLALSPDAGNIGMLALGKLWIVPVGGNPRPVAQVPFEATSLVWSPDGNEVAWSAGNPDQEDLFATNLSTGATRRITALPGREAYPAYSPDGRHLAFVHVQNDDGVLRIVDANATNVTDPARTQSLGSIGMRWASTPQWSPESDGLLLCGAPAPNKATAANFVSLSGERKALGRFPDAPIFLQWTPQHTIIFVRHDRLWQAPFDRTGMQSDPKPIGTAAALYASSARDGTLLFVSAGGLRLRSPAGNEQTIGWPISYTRPVPEPMLIRNVRIIDGTGTPATEPRDILIREGRITRIAGPDIITADGIRVIDAAGRVVIPGLMDLHAHTYRPDLLPGFLYFGITTVRDQGSSMAPMVAYATAISAGVLPGPRVGYGGFQFYSDWSIDEEQGRGLEPEADPNHISRAMDLAEAFGAQHIKTRTFRRWDINARMISEAHRRGLRATGHCSHLLPLVAVAMDAKEHIGSCEKRGDTYMYDDLIQLFRVAGINVVPTISYFELAVRLNERPGFFDDDRELAPFLPAKENFDWMVKLPPAARAEWIGLAQRARETTGKLWRAGINLGTGTDIWQVPTGVHMELEQLVASGLPPLQAIHVGTGGAARILGAEHDLGTIEVGKWADLVLLDADPLADIRNTRRIWHVVKEGELVDRAAILKVMRPR
jgi:Tol biopolymer transport system component/imidazolonepropionase-like amidohydrolase